MLLRFVEPTAHSSGQIMPCALQVYRPRVDGNPMWAKSPISLRLSLTYGAILLVVLLAQIEEAWAPGSPNCPICSVSELKEQRQSAREKQDAVNADRKAKAEERRKNIRKKRRIKSKR